MSSTHVVVSAVFAVVATTSLLAQEASTVQLNISSQPLNKALNAWADQTGYQVMISEERMARGRMAPPIKGTYTPEGALRILLASSDLTYRFVSPRTVAITDADAAPPSQGHELPLAPARSLPRQSQVAGDPTQRLADQQADQRSPARQIEGDGVEQVVVTAQKREERAIDVPISIVAMNAEELKQRKINNLDDLSLAVPGLFSQSNGSYGRTITLRGISNTFGNSSLIGLYLDEAPVTSYPSFLQPDLQTYDLARVEVLRGPQGTLYGEGSVGGTIRFITQDPILSQFGLNAELSALLTETGEPGQRLETAINVPLVEDKLGVRLAGTFDHRGGWMDQPAAGRSDVNGQNLMNVRLKGLWKPTEQLSAAVMAVVHRNHVPPNIGEDGNGNFTQVFGLTTTPAGDDDYEIYNATVSYDFPSVRLLSTSSYLSQDRETRQLGRRFPFTPPGTPLFDAYYPSYSQSNRTFSEELRLTSLGESRLTWTLGAFYRHSKFHTDIPELYFDIPGPAGAPLPAPFLDIERGTLSKSWAAFGDASYEITDRFTVGTGLRYFSDDQEDQISTQTGKFHAVNPRVYAQYRVADQVNAYASVAKGFRSGGYNLPNEPTYGPETVWTYELGTKMAVLEGRLSSDLALFFSDYSDYQINGLRTVGGLPLNITSNGGNARIKGVELALTWRMADRWTLAFTGDYMDSEFYKIDATSTSYDVGDSLDLSPKYGFAASVQHEFRLVGREGFMRVDYDQHGSMSYRNRAGGPWYFSESDVINMLNLSTDLRWNDNVSLGLFAQNLLNDRGFTDPYSIEFNAARARPRTYGVTVGVTF